jgi:hypothetical protein
MFDDKVFINKFENEDRLVIKSLLPPEESDSNSFEVNLELR